MNSCENNLDPDRAKKAPFIVFEGIDGSGKTTQAKKLADYLASRGARVLLTAEPSDGPVGAHIRSLKTRPAPEAEARLFTEDRRDHLSRTILPALAQGVTVICDRYVYSSAAYQGARGIDPESILAENSAFALPADVTFLIEIDVDAALARIASGRGNQFTTFEVRSDLEKVDTIYRSLTDPLIIRINGESSAEQVQRLIMEELSKIGCKCVSSIK